MSNLGFSQFQFISRACIPAYINCFSQGRHNFWGKNSRTFQGLSSTFSRHIPAMFYYTRVLKASCENYLKLQFEISITNCSYTAGDASI